MRLRKSNGHGVDSAEPAAMGTTRSARWRIAAATLTAALGMSAALGSASGVRSSGQFTPLFDWPIIAMHTTLLPDGKVLTFGTDRRAQQTAEWLYDVWNPASGTGPTSHNLLDNQTPNGDIFCSVATLVAGTDQVLLMGGSAIVDGRSRAEGITAVRTFDTSTTALVDAPGQMQFPRWYASAVTMPNGEIVVQGGIKPDIDAPEVFTPNTGTWRTLTGAASASVYRTGRSYPRSWVAPDGLVFGLAGEQMFRLDPSGSGTITSLGQFADNQHHDYATAAMYARGKIIVLGGLPDGRAVTLVDITGPTPIVTAGPPMAHARELYANAVVLPDGRVLVVGGGNGYVETSTVALPAEIWDPATNAWTEVASVQVPRVYHSSALLLPDGGVLVTGGGTPGHWTNLNAEIFRPEYTTAAARPIVDIAPQAIAHDSSFALWMRSAAPIARVTLVRLGSSTHGFDVDQRLMDLSFEQIGKRLDIRAPESLAEAPPGHYMVFALTPAGIPSVGQIVALS